jgi:hypothetical protein
MSMREKLFEENFPEKIPEEVSRALLSKPFWTDMRIEFRFY